MTLRATSGAPTGVDVRRAVAPDLEARDVGKRHLGDDLEPLWIDEAEHRVTGGRLDQIAWIVLTRRDDPVEGRTDDRPRGDRLGRRERRTSLRQGGFGIGDGSLGVFDFLPRGDTSIEQLTRANLRPLRVVERCLRPRDFRLLPLRFRLRARNLESDQQVASSDPIAGCPGHFGNARRIRSNDDELRAWRGRHDRRRVHDATNGANGRGRRLHRDSSLALDLVRRLATTAGNRGERHQDQQGEYEARIRIERHGRGAPTACSRSARADWNCEIESSDRRRTSREACSA